MAKQSAKALAALFKEMREDEKLGKHEQMLGNAREDFRILIDALTKAQADEKAQGKGIESSEAQTVEKANDKGIER